MPRTLSREEFDALKQSVLAALPDNLTEDEFNRQAPMRFEAALGEAENSSTPLTGSALSRFASSAGQMLNPVTMAQGLYQAVRHPIDTASGMAAAQGQQASQAVDLAKQGRYTEAAGHGLAAAVPILGPIAAKLGEQGASGDVAGMAGGAAGLLAPFAADAALAARGANAGRAPMLERAATEQVANRVLAPGNPAFRGRAMAIAPDILERGLKGGRPELQQLAEEGMVDAANRIDEGIASSGGATAPVYKADIVDDLKARIAALQDSDGNPLSDQAAKKIGLLQNKVYQIQSINGPKTPTVMFEDLRKIRDENYGIASQAKAYERQGNPVLSDEGFAARETGSSIRGAFAKRSPETAAANADYSFWKTLSDVLDPVQGRPKVLAPSAGVTGGARTVGAVVGNMVGPKAALVLSTVVPWLKDRMADSSWQLADASSKMKLAAAIKAGDQGAIRASMFRIQKAALPTAASDTQNTPQPATP